MKIRSATLVGHKRLLMLRNIKRLVITPTSPHQMVIGTNGSGKSTLVSELSPLPAASADYLKGGSKTIELDHDGKSYRLVSDFTSGNNYYFYCNGENLNTGRTLTVQKELVKEHFRYTQRLHDVLMGTERFTDMSPLTRREWIIELSGIDLDYAMSLFTTLKSRTRDMAGVVKHLNQRITNETAKIPSEDKLNELSFTCQQIKEELTLMMTDRESGLPKYVEIDHRIDSNLAQIEELSIAIIEANCRRPDFINEEPISCLRDLEQVIANTKGEQITADNMLNHYMEEHFKIRDIVEALEKSNAEGLDDLKRKVAELTNKRDEIRAEIKQFFVEQNAGDILTTSRAVQGELIEVFSMLPDNSDGKYTREKREQTALFLNEKKILKDKLTMELSKYQHRIEHIRTAAHENCPKCGYVWTPGVREGEVGELEHQIGRAVQAIEKTDLVIAGSNEYLAEVQSYSDLLRRYSRLVSANPSLSVLWDYITENKMTTESPKRLLPAFTLWMNDLDACARLENVNKELQTFEAAVEQAAALGGDGHYSERVAYLDEHIEKSTQLKATLSSRLKELADYRSRQSDILTKAAQIEQLIGKVNADTDLLVRVTRRDILNSTIGDHQSQLAHAENALISARTMKAIVADLQGSCQNAVEDGEVFKLLATELSPDSGLIADALKDFLGLMTEQMNNIFAQIWTYPLEILPCGFDGGELDYKFPIRVNESDTPNEDVSRTSLGQTDLINFVFKLIVMLYLEMDDYPLVLDELAASMDDKHRANIFMFVKQLIDTKKCNQIWLISHYQTGHGIFVNAEVCMLDDSNILTIPEITNKHVIME